MNLVDLVGFEFLFVPEDRVGLEFLLVLGKLVLVDFLQPPPIGLTVPRCSKSSRIFPASYPSQNQIILQKLQKVYTEKTFLKSILIKLILLQ